MEGVAGGVEGVAGEATAGVGVATVGAGVEVVLGRGISTTSLERSITGGRFLFFGPGPKVGKVFDEFMAVGVVLEVVVVWVGVDWVVEFVAYRGGGGVVGLLD